MGRWKFRAIALGCVLVWGVAAQVAAQMPIAGVYTCVDARGRKLTADRPIPECADREQNVLNPSGTVNRKIGPTLSAIELAEKDKRDKRELEERNRIADEKRRDRALLVRYPNKKVHDSERTQALAQFGHTIEAAKLRAKELEDQRKKLVLEMEFYQTNPAKAPSYLRRQLDENSQSQAAQQRFIQDQAQEIIRVNARFDEELKRLNVLWGTMAAAVPAAP